VGWGARPWRLVLEPEQVAVQSRQTLVVGLILIAACGGSEPTAPVGGENPIGREIAGLSTTQ